LRLDLNRASKFKVSESTAPMKAKLTVKAKIVHLTRVKQRLLETEYENLQRFLRGERDVPLYSAYKQQALRYYKKVKEGKEYPLSIRKDLLKIERRDTKIAEYWARIPVKGRRGGVWVAIKPHRPIEPDMEICESKLFKKDGEWWLHIVVQKEVEKPKPNPRRIIAIDIGDRNIATKVELVDGEVQNPKFYGREVRGIRRHYDWLRRRLGEKRLLKKIKQIGRKEHRRVDDVLHKISREVVNRAKELGATIVIGNLKGIRKKNRGRTLNRIVNRMPYYRLTEYIKYKAEWEGIPVLVIPEYNTSKTCHRCGKEGKRVSQGLFKCPNCGLEYNTDLNGAINIAKLSLGYMLRDGAELTQPLTPHEGVELACGLKPPSPKAENLPASAGRVSINYLK